jgi:Ni,Fe-hydrogenase III small subunit
MAPPVLVAFSAGAQPTTVASPTCAISALVAPPTCATSAPVDGIVPLATTVSGILNPPEPSPNTWRNLFASNRNTTSCPKLIHYSAFTETRGCNLVDDDLDTKCDY